MVKWFIVLTIKLFLILAGTTLLIIGTAQLFSFAIYMSILYTKQTLIASAAAIYLIIQIGVIVWAKRKF
jgi:hypothetical protein